MERRLAAMVIPDVAGDSRPIGADEARRRDGIALVAVLWVLVLLLIPGT